MKLTTLSKVLITLLLIVGLFFLFRYLIPATDGDQSNEGESIENVDQSKTKSSEVKGGTFNFKTSAPVNGSMKGVVELGASGFNSFIVTIDQEKNWKLEKAEWGNSLVIDGLATGEDVRTGLKKYIAGMLDYGVPGKDIHFVVSSGAKKVETTQMIIDELKKMNYVVNTVTPEEEAMYALKSVLPAQFEDKAFVIDIGSGNTKMSWMNGDKIVGKESYGAKYYNNGIPDDQVYNEVKNIASSIPADKRSTCFIIGGVPFSLAKMDRNGEERFTQLRNPQDYTADGAKMKSGLNIYKAIQDATSCKTFVFDWHANFTIGFLLSI
jgi:hypothetical protein